jgi:uncharacterized protein (DUF4415 family)
MPKKKTTKKTAPKKKMSEKYIDTLSPTNRFADEPLGKQGKFKRSRKVEDPKISSPKKQARLRLTATYVGGKEGDKAKFELIDRQIADEAGKSFKASTTKPSPKTHKNVTKSNQKQFRGGTSSKRRYGNKK